MPLPNIGGILAAKSIIRFQFMSDLHLEIGQQYSEFSITQQAPYLILAGDIGRLIDRALFSKFLSQQCKLFKLVLLVLGNHEFFGTSHEDGIKEAQRLEREPEMGGKLKVLHRQRVDMEEEQLVVLGCALWSFIPPTHRLIVESKVNDFKKISSWNVDSHNSAHNQDLIWLRGQIAAVRFEEKHQNLQRRKILVVSHHAPAIKKSSAPKHRQNAWTCAFATDLLCEEAKEEDRALLQEVGYWVFGHTHYTTKFMEGQVKVVSNQRGYIFPNEKAPRKEAEKGYTRKFRWTWVSKKHRNDSFDVKKTISI